MLLVHLSALLDENKLKYLLPVYYLQVVSDKQLVKHLQKEVARLEAERRTPGPSTEKDFKIQQVSVHFRSPKYIIEPKLWYLVYGYFVTFSDGNGNRRA